MNTSRSYPVVTGLFTWPSDSPSLIGARCGECETLFFPSFLEHHRTGCSGGPVEEYLLSRTGTLISYTVQRYCPPPPYPQTSPFEPFVLGTVALPDGIQVAGRIAVSEPTDVEVGAEVELIVDALEIDDEGNEALTWMFRLREKESGGLA